MNGNADETIQYVREALFAMRDEGYAAFHRHLIPTVDPARVIGVRTPALRAFVRTFSRMKGASDFLLALPHEYYEENAVHCALISEMRAFGETCLSLNAFLPYVDNWAICDAIAPRAFKDRPEGLAEEIDRWLSSDHPFTVRFGIGMLLKYYLSDPFDPDVLRRVSEVRSEEYYVNMMIAWFFATALSLRFAETLPYIEDKRLDPWTHNKAIRKAIESRRVGEEEKKYLRTLTRR